MNRLILHIGMHKTGSTSIQQFLSQSNNDNLIFPDLEYANQSIPLYTVFSKQYLNYHSWKIAGLSFNQIESKRLDYLESLKEALSNNLTQDIIFSAEDLTRLTFEEVRDMLDFFQSYSTHRIEVYAYVREPISFIQSAIGQNIREGIINGNLHQLNYRRCFEPYINILGAERVNLRLYDRAIFSEGDVVTDFCHWVGIPHQKNADYSTHVNSSTSTEATRLVYLLNKTNPLSYEGKDLSTARLIFINVLRDLFPGPFVIPMNLISENLKHSETEWVETAGNFKFKQENETCSENNYQSIADYLSDIDCNTVDVLLDFLKQIDINYDFGRDMTKIVNRLYYACITNYQHNITFNSERYLDINPDVKQSGMNPYEHYLRFGVREGRAY